MMNSGIESRCLINGVQYKCRTCFDPGRTIYSLTDEASNTKKSWRDLLKDIAQLQIHNDELLPTTLCCKCLDKLKKSYDFVLQIHNVNDKYSELLKKEEVLIEFDNVADCLAESAIALPLEQYLTEIKMEDEMVVSNDIDRSENKKLQSDTEATFENEDTDDPFTETFDEDLKPTCEQSKEKESVTPMHGKRSSKRIRIRKRKDTFSIPVKRTRKAKKPKDIKKTSQADKAKNHDDNDAKTPDDNDEKTPDDNDEKTPDDNDEKTPDDNDEKKPIVCSKCKETFFTIYAYQRHKHAEHSSDSKEEGNKCPICSKEFRNRFYVLNHIKVVHDKLRPFKCSHCTKSFATAASKKLHELSHTDNFPYQCEFCDRRFRVPSTLKIHSEIHTTKPELLCRICKRSQKSQEDFEAHMKHHDDNRFQCPSCGRLFRKRANLDEHFNVVHLNLRPEKSLECPACGHLFRKRTTLNDHYNAVHLKLRPFKCEFCELGFGDRKTRSMHQKSRHKKELIAKI